MIRTMYRSHHKARQKWFQQVTGRTASKAICDWTVRDSDDEYVEG